MLQRMKALHLESVFAQHVISSSLPCADSLRAASCTLAIVTFSDEYIFLTNSACAESALIPFAQALYYVGEAQS